MSRFIYAFLLCALFSPLVIAQTPSPPAAPAPDNKPSTAPRAETVSKPPLKDQAWELLRGGIEENSTDKRASAVHVLSLLTGETRAVRLASRALSDPKPQVRVAAAEALGELHAKSAIPTLEKALSDKEPLVTLAAAHSLLTMKDALAYEVYYEILTGERRSNKGLVAEQLDTLRDPKKMALLGFQEGIGFVPFAGIGYTAYRTVMKDDGSPVRAAAAKVLIEDHDTMIEDAMIRAATEDKNHLVRVAALDALARRGNPAVIDRIAPAMADDKDAVKYTAAAAILHLSDVAENRKSKKETNHPHGGEKTAATASRTPTAATPSPLQK
jgi:HEAT repeat protein